MMTSASHNRIPSIFVLGASGFVGQQVWKLGAQEQVTLTALRRHGQVDETLGKVIQGDMASFDWSSLSAQPPDAIIHTARISGRTAPERYLAGWRGWLANRSLERWRTSINHTKDDSRLHLPHSEARASMNTRANHADDGERLSQTHSGERLHTPTRLVFASGSLVYGDCGTTPVYESNPLRPIAFQRSYVRAEKPFLKRAHQPDAALCIARLPWIYGAGSWFAQFYIRTARRDGYVTQYGSGKQLMSLIHVEDAAGMMLSLATNTTASGVYNLVGGPAVSHGDFCRLVARELGLPVKEMPETQVWSKFGKTVAEALTFSSDVRTEREELQSYILKHPSLETSIRDVITALDR